MASAILTKVVRWIIHWLGARTISIFLLLFLTLFVLAQSINGLVPSLDAFLLLVTVVLGELVGWVTARSRISGRIAVPLILLIGMILIAIRIGQLAPRLVDLAYLIGNAATQIYHYPLYPLPDMQPILQVLYDIAIRFNVLYSRIFEWLRSILASHSNFDPVAASMAWSIVLWGVSCWAAWSIRRNWHVFEALIPALALLTLICAYTGANTLLLTLPVLCVLLLLVIVSHGRREASWIARGIDFSEDIRVDITVAVLPISVGLVAIGWLMPSISLEQIARMAQQAVNEPMNQARPLPNALGLKPQPVEVPGVNPELRAPGLPRSHLIGSGPELSHETVMVISTGDLPPAPPYAGLPPQQVPNYYWRGSTYDYYSGGGWVSTDVTSRPYDAASTPISSTTLAQRLVRQQVQLRQDEGNIVYSAGTVVAVDRDFRIAWRSHEDAFAASLVNSADAYTADSLHSIATVDQLRTVPSQYADWIRERYLKLPDEVPSRVLALARDLTATSPTPYDRAVAIETYLRTYSYTLDIPAPRPGVDIADYFLFDLQRGYCDYFATSMVVLARAAGLPARLVVGYATGTYDTPAAQYIVTQADAHSWPEVYFNEYGWIEFEPTSGLAPINRPSTSSDVVQGNAAIRPLQPRHLFIDELGWVVPLSLLVLCCLAIIGWLIWDTWSLSRRTPRDVLGALYTRLYSNGRRLAVPLHSGDTPFEYSTAVVQQVSVVAPQIQNQPILRSTSSDINQLVDLYVRSTYGGYQPDSIDRWHLITIWQRLRWRLWLTAALVLSRRLSNKRQALLQSILTRS